MSQPSVLAIRNVMQRPSSLPPSKILSFPQNSENSTSSPQAKMTCEPSPNMASETRKPKRLSKRFSQHFPKSRSSDNDGAQEIKRGSTGGFFSNGFSLRTTSYSNSSSTVSSSSSSSTASTTPSTAPSTTPSPPSYPNRY
ncbi:hypothetical protein CC78DRAFT_306021 [Lojkania enalia]|uniref:Uncharacterized protein n=1 Tax=Lojkania enalia TaxID=147567 RepID=A0A9P4N9Q7_9PLEO|nr:hypothetical protein CC78DRAFT_306021 [Didymosphaeria enalia]